MTAAPPFVCLHLKKKITGVKVGSMSASSTATHSVSFGNNFPLYDINWSYMENFGFSSPPLCSASRHSVFQQGQWQLITLFQLCCSRGRRMSGQQNGVKHLVYSSECLIVNYLFLQLRTFDSQLQRYLFYCSECLTVNCKSTYSTAQNA